MQTMADIFEELPHSLEAVTLRQGGQTRPLATPA